MPTWTRLQPWWGLPQTYGYKCLALSCTKPLRLQAQLPLWGERSLGGTMSNKHLWKDAWDFFFLKEPWQRPCHKGCVLKSCPSAPLPHAGHTVACSYSLQPLPCCRHTRGVANFALWITVLLWLPLVPAPKLLLGCWWKSQQGPQQPNLPCWSEGVKIKQVHSAPRNTATCSTNAFCCQQNFEESQGLHIEPYVGYHSAPRLSISGFLLLTPSINANGINCKSPKSILWVVWPNSFT